jgi:phage major head subunit gpT-like protein
MGIYMPTVSFMGIQARKIWDYKTRDMLQNQGSMTGPFQNGTDALTYFHGSHPVDFWDSTKGTYANDYRGAVTVGGISVGGGFSTNGFNTVWEDHAARKSESGENLGILPDLSMFPLQMRAAAMTILQSQFYAPPQMGTLGSGSGANAAFVGAMDNPLRGWTDVFINPDLSNANDWYMWTTKAPIKPISLLLRLAPDFTPRNTPQDPIVFNEHKILYGSKARGTTAWGFPWLGSIDGPTAGQ